MIDLNEVLSKIKPFVLGWIGQALTSVPRYPPELLFYDTFTGPDGTLLEARLPDYGAGWTAARGSMELVSNQGKYKAGSSSPVIEDTGLSLAGCTMTALLYPTNTGGEAGFCVRRTGAALTWHYITVTSQGGITGKMEIVRRNPLAVLATSGSIGICQGSAYILEVTLSGDDITATLRGFNIGAVTITANDATNSATKTYGLFMGAVGVQIDEFQVIP